MTFNRLLAFILSFAALLSCAAPDGYISFSGYAQGGTYTVKVNMKDVKVSPEAIRDSVDSILRRIDNSLSGYNKGSLLSRFNAGESIRPDEIFLDIYGKSYLMYEQTGGVLDVASAPLYDAWGFGFKHGELPSEEKLKEILDVSGMGRLKEDMVSVLSDEGTLRGTDILKDGEKPVVRLNYNAVAQGYSCDLVAAYLYSIGVKDMMVDIGEIYCDGKNPSGNRWTIGIDRPTDGNNEIGAQIQGIFKVPEGPHGVVTSGNYRKFYVKDGKKYAHTIDPNTGYPVQHNLLCATILAPDAFTADAYATYCMVIGLDSSKEFLASRPDLEGCLIYDEDGEFRTWCSDGFVLVDPK